MSVLRLNDDEFGHELVLQGTVHQVKVFDLDEPRYPVMLEVFGLHGEVTAMLDHDDVTALHGFLGRYVRAAD